MKKFLTLTIAFVLLLATLLSLTACSLGSISFLNNNYIQYGKKYMRTTLRSDKESYYTNENHYYVFNKDKTGYKYYRYVYNDEYKPQNNYTISGRVDFVWREGTSDDIHLFVVEVHYDNDHTDGKIIEIFNSPIYFVEDCLIDIVSASKFIVEDSELEKTIKKDKD